MIKITENIVKYNDIGDVRYVYNRKARNFTIRINQKGEVRVTVPRFGSMKKAEAFLFSRRIWVRKKLLDIEKRNAGVLLLREGEIIEIRGKKFEIKQGKNGESPEQAFWKILLDEAKQMLPARVKEVSIQYGLPYKDLKIKKMKSRWGSCSPNNSINLNSWLVLMPDHLIDYVILHELVHTIHKNHSPQFWDYLDKLMNGKSQAYRKELRENRIIYRVE